MSLEKPEPNSENPIQNHLVVYPLEDVVYHVSQVNDSDSVKPLDMPLLTDLPKRTEIFFNTNDNSNNNNKTPRDSHNFDNGFIEKSNKYQTEADTPVNLCLESQYLHDLDKVINNCTSYHSDQSLTNSNAAASDDVISEFLVFHKQPMECDPKLKNGCYVKLKKIPKTEQPITIQNRRVTRSQSRLFSTVPNRKSKKAKQIQPRVVKGSISSSRPIDDLKSSLSSENRPKILLKIVRKKQAKRSVYQCFDLCQQSNQSAIKECSVAIEPMHILNPPIPLYCGKRKRSAMENDMPLDLTVRTATKNHLSTKSLTESLTDIDPAPTEIGNELVAASVRISIPTEGFGLIDKESNGLFNFTEKEAISNTDDPDDGDNCSVSSGLSIHAPSYSDITNSPNRNDAIDAISNAVEQERSDDAKVEEILALTIKKMPKMVSPIRGPKSSYKKDNKDLKVKSIPTSTAKKKVVEKIETSEKVRSTSTAKKKVLEKIGPSKKVRSNDKNGQQNRQSITKKSSSVKPSKSEESFKLAKRSKLKAESQSTKQSVKPSNPKKSLQSKTTTVQPNRPIKSSKSEESLKLAKRSKLEADSQSSKRITTEKSFKPAVLATLDNFVKLLGPKESFKSAVPATLDNSVKLLGPKESFKSAVPSTLDNSVKLLDLIESSKPAVPATLDNYVKLLDLKESSKSAVPSTLDNSVKLEDPKESLQSKTKTNTSQSQGLRNAHKFDFKNKEMMVIKAASGSSTRTISLVGDNPSSITGDAESARAVLPIQPLQSTNLFQSVSPSNQSSTPNGSFSSNQPAQLLPVNTLPQQPTPSLSLHGFSQPNQYPRPNGNSSLNQSAQLQPVSTLPQQLTPSLSLHGFSQPNQYPRPNGNSSLNQSAQLQPVSTLPEQSAPLLSPRGLPQPNHCSRANVNVSLPVDQQPTKYLLSPGKKLRFRDASMSLFEQPCMSFLFGRQCAKDCKYSHELPMCEKVYKKMSTFPNEKLHFIYNDSIANSRIMFEYYFAMICHLFSMRKMRQTLATLVTDCEKYERYDFFKIIFFELLRCEMSKKDALMIIVDRYHVCSASDQVILEIIQDDPASFIEILGRYTHQLTPQIVNTLMEQVSLDPNLRLKCDVVFNNDRILGTQIYSLMLT